MRFVILLIYITYCITLHYKNDNFINMYNIIIFMPKVIENKYKSKDGKIHKRYFMTLPKELIISKGIKKGDNFIFNGEFNGEWKFSLQRKIEFEQNEKN